MKSSERTSPSVMGVITRDTSYGHALLAYMTADKYQEIEVQKCPNNF